MAELDLQSIISGLSESKYKIKGSTKVLTTGSYIPRTTELSKDEKPSFKNSRLLVSVGDSDIVAKELLDYVFPNKMLRHYGHSFWLLKDGFYQVFSEDLLKHYLLEFISRNVIISQCVMRNGEMSKKTDDNTNPTKFVDKELIAQLRQMTQISKQQAESQWLSDDSKPIQYNTVIPTIGGLYNFMNGEMYQHDPRLFIHACVPIVPDGTSKDKPSLFNTFINETLPDKQQQLLLFEYIGMLLTGSTLWQTFLILYGKARSGKTTITKLIETMIGEDNCKSRNADNFTDRFGLEGLDTASVCFLPEFTTGRGQFKKFIERIKAITGDDVIAVENKFGKIQSMRLPTRFVISTNQIPYMTEMSSAIRDRLLCIAFYNSVPRHKKDVTLINKLCQPHELQVLLAHCIEGVKRLYTSGWFTKTIISEDLIDDIDMQMNSTKAFAYECLEFTDDDAVVYPCGALYELYLKYCKENMLDNIRTQNMFTRELKDLHPKLFCKNKTVKKGYSPRMYHGIAFRPNYFSIARDKFLQHIKGNSK